jgi:hypothetical protein
VADRERGAPRAENVRSHDGQPSGPCRLAPAPRMRYCFAGAGDRGGLCVVQQSSPGDVIGLRFCQCARSAHSPART